jgi:N-acetylneuraminic acid mutarotase
VRTAETTWRRRLIGGSAALGATALAASLSIAASVPSAAAAAAPASTAVSRAAQLALPASELATASGDPLAKTTALDRAAANPAAAAPAATPTAWKSIPNYPQQIQDNVAGFNAGTVYSASGWNWGSRSLVTNFYSFTAGATSWKQLASTPDGRDEASGGFINGLFYVTGGWNSNDDPDGNLDVYNPATNSWSTAAANPAPVAAAGTAVLGDDLYIVGGCSGESCGAGSRVEAYNTQTNTWSQVASYPESVSYEACGAIEGLLYCAGGVNGGQESADAFVFNPATNAWSSIAPLPTAAYGGAYTEAGGQLYVEGGAVDDGFELTTSGWSYSPADNEWTDLPTALFSSFRAGSALGFYAIGGVPNFGQIGTSAQASSEVLPGLTAP